MTNVGTTHSTTTTLDREIGAENGDLRPPARSSTFRRLVSAHLSLAEPLARCPTILRGPSGRLRHLRSKPATCSGHSGHAAAGMAPVWWTSSGSDASSDGASGQPPHQAIVPLRSSRASNRDRDRHETPGTSDIMPAVQDAYAVASPRDYRLHIVLWSLRLALPTSWAGAASGARWTACRRVDAAAGRLWRRDESETDAAQGGDGLVEQGVADGVVAGDHGPVPG